MIEFELQKLLSGSSGKLQLELEGNIDPGDFITLSGSSGAGKTSFLRMIAGLTVPDHGNLKVNNAIWYNSTKQISLKPQDRSVGLVFQDLALFPNMTAEGNVRFASNNKSDVEITQLLSVMELSELRNRLPDKLSRGQQQRVAIARALAQDPTILLLDEPFSALDIKLKTKLLSYLKELHQNYSLTIILVTHDPTISAEISNRIWELSDGRIHNSNNKKSISDSVKIASAEKIEGKWNLILEDETDVEFAAGMTLRKL